LRKNDLTSGDQARIDHIASGGKRFDVGDWPASNLSALFKVFKNETFKSNEAADLLKNDKGGSESEREDKRSKESADRKLDNARTELDKVIAEKDAWVKLVAIKDFDIQIALPNAIPLLTVHVRTPAQ
jgi:hypothetical protein